MGEKRKKALPLVFDRSLKLEFRSERNQRRCAASLSRVG